MAPQRFPAWLPMLGWASAAVGLLLLLRDLTRIGESSAISTVFEIGFDLFLVVAGLIIAAAGRTAAARGNGVSRRR
jgi:hypothetical protein